MPADRYQGASDELDVDRPSTARVYDAFLGGDHNFAADRAFAARARAALPHVSDVARWNRTFLRNAVETMISEGIDQFLDLGAGLPTAGCTHEVAQRHDPRATVVYVDNEPMAATHIRDLLDGHSHTSLVEADFLEPEEVLNATRTQEMLDFSRPVGLLAVALLHFLPDQRSPADALERYKAAVAPGSYLAISHATVEHVSEPVRSQTLRFIASYEDTKNPEFTARDEAQFREFLAGWEVLEPGVVFTSQWRSDLTDLDVAARRPENAVCFASVARKPDHSPPVC